MRHDLFVVVLRHGDLFESMSFIELLGRIIGDLHMEVDRFHLRLRMGGRCLDNMFQTLCTQSS